MTKPPVMQLRDVLSHEYVDTHGAAHIAGIAYQTMMNLRHQHPDTTPTPLGQVQLGMSRANIYARAEIVEWAAERKGVRA